VSLTRFDIESTKLDGTGRTLDDAVEFEGDAAAAAMTVIFYVPGSEPLQAEVLEKTKKVGDTTVYYKPVLPNLPFIQHRSRER
jgi:hypothetical protein